ncbi:hypothetical protein [Leptospira meyeri]|uniref:hypothetical protein n=1 Tax=Leptospira meyeri TaxID=29508 RepID=UPI00223E5A7A|nr:hypothetical protein [Leptospira meyeri]MCW7490887.1 hypothetical protein [Leptospira meyeri]
MKDKIFLALILLTSIFNLTSYFYFKNKSNYVTKMVFELKLETVEGKHKLVISKDSIDEFDKKVKILQESFLEYESLLSIFEREREHYIILLSLLIGIMTIFTIYFGFTRLVEKQEYDEIRKDFEKLSNSITNELNILDRKSIKFEIISFIDQLKSEVIFVDGNNKRITNLENFQIFLELKISKLSKKVNEFDSTFIYDHIHYFRNLLLNASKYARKKEYIEHIKLDTKVNPVFRTIIKAFYINLDEEIYNSLIEYLVEIHPSIDFENFKLK